MRTHLYQNGPAVKAPRIQPLQLVGVIFTGLGLLFTVMGVIFLTLSPELLPRLFTAEVWLNEPPDEMELPLCGLIFAFSGLIFLIIGGCMLLFLRRQKHLREELERYGMRVTGMVSDIVVDRTYRVNGRHPLRYLIAVRNPITGEEQLLRSGPVWETTLSPGDGIDILFDPQDEKKHIVILPE